MSRERLVAGLLTVALAGVLLAAPNGAQGLWASSAGAAAPLTPSPPYPTAVPLALTQASAEWSASAHADSYDGGQGANTTCARCKAPRNWDPSNPAAEQALDCGACKRLPGASRPELAAGQPVALIDWRNIGCDVCHPPAGDSVSSAIAFWNQATQSYEVLADSAELCARCHEGRHGFDVTHEQSVSPAHRGWDCTACHGAHGRAVACTDCHDPTAGKGAAEHALHLSVNCTGCHDAGALGVWRDQVAGSRHHGQTIALRFAHTLTSWPSHNLRVAVDCRRCHHPRSAGRPALENTVTCAACHGDGAGLTWCPAFQRDAPAAPESGPRLP
jgi:hypothetical protein